MAEQTKLKRFRYLLRVDQEKDHFNNIVKEFDRRDYYHIN